MKPLKKRNAKTANATLKAAKNVARTPGIHITLVSEKERELYGVPSYGYLLP